MLQQNVWQAFCAPATELAQNKQLRSKPFFVQKTNEHTLGQPPSSTPVTMEAKLSSNKIMSAACFDTSLPDIPMATPMSARLSAGESFTPSPVTATIAPYVTRDERLNPS